MVNLIPHDALTKLIPAADAKTVSAGAQIAQQVNAVAYAINSAANTGEFRAIYNGALLSEVVSLLTDQGYNVAVNSRAAHAESVISWA